MQDTPATAKVHVVVPDGLWEGSAFMVHSKWGGEFEVTVPPGCGPGNTIEVELPLPSEGTPFDDSEGAASSDSDESSLRTEDDEKHYSLGRDVSPPRYSGASQATSDEQQEPPGAEQPSSEVTI